ncbi:cytochrome P450 [Nonomuraea sp. NPDC048916]|uniref:cytochrome P450 n=1 Tax=Nonomuraea sp. NPDC048916 TaxID=3154232 RepID=UPI0033C71DDE
MTKPPALPDSAASPSEPGRESPDGYPDHADAVRLYEPEMYDDPAALYEEMRRKYGPVVPVLLDGDVPAWLVIGYRELHHVTSQPQLFGRDPRRWNLSERLPPDWPLRSYVTWAPSVVFTEGAERMRRGGAIGDSLDEIDRTELTLICEQVADLVIDAFAGDGRADLVSQYASRIPAQVIARIFGMPEADVPALVEEVTIVLDGGKDAFAMVERIVARVTGLLASKRARPDRDVMSGLLAHPAGLTDDEIVHDTMTLVMASHGSSANWIGNTLRLMLVDDHFQMDLQGGRSSVGEALNQVLWKDPPMQNTPARFSAQDCELAGHRIRRGDLLVLSLAAANADPQVQPGADAYTGPNRAHMSFSHGEYGCPYPAPELGEIIAKTAVEVLLDRLPDVHLVVAPEDLRWRRSIWIRALESLPVQFTPGTPIGRPSSHSWDDLR